MNACEIVRAGDHRVMAWKNGGGSTAEIAVFPREATLGDFEWRVSMAHVGADGPFSSFPGIDRTLAILNGDGVVLAIDDRDPVTLTPTSQPLSFSADARTTCALVDGPVDDLNVMTRGASFRHAVRRLAIEGEAAIDLTGAWGIVFCARGRVRIDIESREISLGRRDALVVTGGIGFLAHGQARADVLLIAILAA